LDGSLLNWLSRALRIFRFRRNASGGNLGSRQGLTEFPHLEPARDVLFANPVEASFVAVKLRHFSPVLEQNYLVRRAAPTAAWRRGTFCKLLNRTDLFRLKALGPLLYDECHLRALFKGAVSAGLDGRKMHEDIFPIFTRQKSKAFGGVKPLHSSCFFHNVLFLAIYVR